VNTKRIVLFLLLFTVPLLLLVGFVGALNLSAQGTTATYVGVNVCKGCHPTIYDTWKETLHNKMLRPATFGPNGTVVGNFSTLTTELGISYTWGIDRILRGDGMVVGFGENVQRYIVQEGGDWILLPIEWFSPRQPDNPNGSWHAAAAPTVRASWTASCAGCHSTGYDPASKTYKDPGITCEACHGPGSEHVAGGFLNPPGQRRVFVKPDAQVCGACHLRAKTGTTGYPIGYTPGMTLSEHITFIPYTENRWWQTGAPYHARRHRQQYLEWIQTGHAAALDTLRSSDHAQDRCLQCHSADYRIAVAKGRTPPTVATAQYSITCQVCHAPHTPGRLGSQLRPVTNAFVSELCSRCHTPAPDPATSAAAEELLLCADCHTSGRAITPLQRPSEIHHPMVEAFTGVTTATFGLDEPMPSTMHQAGVTCANCHMPATATNGNFGDVSTHVWKPISPTLTNLVTFEGQGIPNACTNGQCHQGIAGKGFAWSADPLENNRLAQAVIDRRQSEIKAQVEHLKEVLDAKIAISNTAEYKLAWTAVSFVESEGSWGIHNYAYDKAILAKAEQALGLVTPRPGYVGPQVCADCHGNLVNNVFPTSLHPKMIQEPSPSTVKADFSLTTTIRLEDVVYTLGWKYRQRYIVKEGNDLVVAPVQWNIDQTDPTKGRWVAAAKSSWTQNCLGCHVTNFVWDPTANNGQGAGAGQVGVWCERCHGPGEEHARSKEHDKIVIPLDAQICGACHNRGTDPATGKAWPVDFTPGMTLTFNSVPFSDTNRWWQTPGQFHAREHRQQYPEYKQTRHFKSLAPAAFPFFQDRCLECHSEDYRFAVDRGQTPPTKQTARYGITCVTCHSAHGAGRGGNQLARVDTSSTSFVGPFCQKCHTPLPDARTNKAAAELYLCAQCHNAESIQLLQPPGAIHHPMIEAFTGAVTDTFGLAAPIPSTMHQAGVYCANCHMPGTAKSANPGDIGTHSWKIITPGLSISGPAAGVPNACTNGGCHGGSVSDEDLQNILEIRQARIKRDLGILQARLEAKSALSQTTEYKLAYTAYSFLTSEGSYGLHNYDYANALLLAANAALDFPNTLEAVHVNTPPTLDGDPSDAAWAAAPELDIGALDVKMKAVYTDQDLYLLVTWLDPTASFTRGGAWTWDGRQWGHTSGQNEDRVTIMWDKDTPDFDQRGCSTKCHPGSHEPGGEDDAWLASGKADLWHMKAARSLPAISVSQTGSLTVDPQTHQVTAGTVTFSGYADDTWVGQWSAANAPDGGRYGDAGRSSYANNQSADATAPKYIETAPADFVDAMTLYQSEIDAGEAVEVAGLTSEQLNTYWANYAALNAVVPERILRLPAGSRADVLQAATWKDGQWMLEFKRALNTGHPDDDTIFDDLNKAYKFGIATMDNSGGEKHVTSGLYNLVFKVVELTPTPTDTPTPTATSTPTDTPTPTATFTPTDTPTPTNTPTPIATPTPSPVTVQILAARSATGYVDSRSLLRGFFGMPDMWTGVDTRPKTPRYLHGVTQFDIGSSIPANARLVSVEVELAGRSTRYLDPFADGEWTLQLLDSAVDAAWARPGFGYWQVHYAGVTATIPPALSKADVDVGKVNKFTFTPAQLAAVQQRLSTTGKLSFRLDGTTTAAYARQIFDWNGWQPPILRVVYIP